MQILNKDELLSYDKTKLENLYAVSKKWLECDFIDKKQYDNLINNIKY